LSRSSYRLPRALVWPAMLLFALLLIAIIASALKITAPDTPSTTKPLKGSLASRTSFSVDSLSIRCASIDSVIPLTLPGVGENVPRQVPRIFFDDDPLNGVISENFYLFELNKPYRVSVIKKANGKIYLTNLAFTCGYKPPVLKNFRIMPREPNTPKPPLSLAMVFYLYFKPYFSLFTKFIYNVLDKFFKRDILVHS
jgi:hypothetical protein